MKNPIFRRVLTILLALILVGSTSVLLLQLSDRRQAEKSREYALQIAVPEVETPSAEPEPAEQPSEPAEPSGEQSVQTVPDVKLPLVFKPGTTAATTLPQEVEALRHVNLEALQQVNGDVFGWICLPDTVISYPMVKSHDNADYLNLTWDRQKSRSGSVFLERRSSVDLSDFHTLLYGHNWQDGIMFSPLLQYGKQEFADAHANVYLITEDRILQYTVFSAYTADVVSNTYRLVFEDDARRQECIDFWKEKSVIATELTPEVTDRVLTLSTCTGRGNPDIRWVVHTVLTAEYPR